MQNIVSTGRLWVVTEPDELAVEVIILELRLCHIKHEPIENGTQSSPPGHSGLQQKARVGAELSQGLDKRLKCGKKVKHLCVHEVFSASSYHPERTDGDDKIYAVL